MALVFRWTLAERLLFAALLAASACSPLTDRTETPSTAPPGAGVIVFMSFGDEPSRDDYLNGALLAASQSTGAPMVVEDGGTPDAVEIAAAAGRKDVVGLLVVGGEGVIAPAARAMDAESLPVFELRDDLYQAEALVGGVFQVRPPHSWQAWRLARYFGPGDRSYKRVGLLRREDSAGRAASESLNEELARRDIDFIDVPTTDLDQGIESLRGAGAEAVVVEGPPVFLETAAKALSAGGTGYQGRSKILAGGGWRPQVAGFESLLGIGDLAPGSVATSDYAWPSPAAAMMERVGNFRETFRARFGDYPGLEASAGYEAAKTLMSAIQPGPQPNRSSLQSLDRSLHSRIPVSLSPTDQVLPERDVLGLFARGSGDAWEHLMRTFTSDLERTNILEEDWATFFDGTTPGGEAPFYRQAKTGVVSDAGDDLS